jgi:hypothetical protein
MGVVVTTNSAQAARQIEESTDATHVTSIADMHKAFESGDETAARMIADRSQKVAMWLALNPVDLFRAVNLPTEANVTVPLALEMFSIAAWLLIALGCASWKLHRIDL